MKAFSKIATLFSICLTTFWGIVLIASVVAQCYYTSTDLDTIDYALSKSMYNVFIIVAILGILSSLLLIASISVLKRWDSPSVITITNKSVVIISSVCANVIFYIFLFLLFFVNYDILLFILPVWLISTIISACSLIVVLRKRQMAAPKQ